MEEEEESDEESELESDTEKSQGRDVTKLCCMI